MSKRTAQDVVKRWEDNPIITAGDIPFPCNTVFNAGAVKIDDDGTLKIYYSGADTCICVGTVRLEELMRFCAIGEENK